MPSVLNCADVKDCSNTSWDLLFCICNGGGCIPATASLTYTNHDGDSGLVGVYSTTWSAAGQSPSTGGGAATWNNIDNARADDGAYATVAGDTPIGPGGTIPLGSSYLVLTGPGLNIPAGSTILGIALGLKALFPTVLGGTMGVYNVALTLGGTLYYLLDPRGDFQQSGYSPQPPYPSGYGQAGGIVFPEFLSSDLFVTTYPLAFPTGTSSSLPGARYGHIPGCDNFWELGPIEKDFVFSSLKQSWTPAEVNDPSFGAAVSVYAGSHGETLDVDCLAIAVYYIPGPVVKVRRPNVCINT